MGKPQIIASVDALDAFATPESVAVRADKLRECMVLVDPDLGTPVYWLDHRTRAARNSGNVQWLAHNLETGRLEQVSFRASLALPVIAA